MGRAHEIWGASAASRGQGTTIGRCRPRLLALPLSVVALALAPTTVAPAHAEGLEEPGCQPWICRPSTAGVATVEGVVVRSSSSTRNFEPSRGGFAYRSVQFNRESNGSYAEERLGPLRSVKLTPTEQNKEKVDTFKFSLPACSPANRVFGCMGGEYEGYVTYNGQECSEKIYFFMTVGEVNELPSTLLECAPPKPDPKPQQKQRKRTKRGR